MALLTACPKPRPKDDLDKWVDRVKKARAQQAKWRRRAIARAKGKPRRAIPKVNVRATKRRNLNYRKVISSDFHKQLRYQAYLRSKGLCECAECRGIRKEVTTAYVRGIGEPELTALAQYAVPAAKWSIERIAHAFEEIPVWFTKKGGEPWRRFRSDRGEVHHTSYAYFGQENPAELSKLEFTWDDCHQRIEAEHGTRRRFLKGAT